MTKTAIAALRALSSEVAPADTWPDGTKMDEWFLKDAPVGAGGRVYRLVDYGRFPDNGDNDRILVEGLTASVGTHSALTLGSESVRCRNVVFRNSAVEGCGNLLNLLAPAHIRRRPRQARASFQGRLFRRCRGGRPVISQGGIP